MIRPALPRDRRAVFAAIRTIWGGTDYLLRTFDEWVRMRRDRLFVAELDEERDLLVRALAGDAAGARDLLARLRAVAHAKRLATVSACRPTARLARTFATAGYRAPWRHTVAYFERPLRGVASRRRARAARSRRDARA